MFFLYGKATIGLCGLSICATLNESLPNHLVFAAAAANRDQLPFGANPGHLHCREIALLRQISQILAISELLNIKGTHLKVSHID